MACHYAELQDSWLINIGLLICGCFSVCAAGLNGLKRDDDTLRMVSFAAEAIHAASETFVKTPRGTESLQLRVGIHTGSVMACVTSDLNPRYSLIGEALQHAQALEANGEPMKISISQAAKKLLEKQCGGSFSFGKQKCVALEGRSAIEVRMLSDNNLSWFRHGVAQRAKEGSCASVRLWICLYDAIGCTS